MARRRTWWNNAALRTALIEGGGASAYASMPAPSGSYWDFVTFNGERVTFNGVPVVALVGIS